MKLHMCCTGAGSHVHTLPDLRAVSRTLWPSQQAHTGNCLRSSYHITHKHQEQQRRQCRAQVVTKAGVAAASGQTLASQALSHLEPQLAFIAHTLCCGMLLPILGGWLFATALSAVASRARQWCDEHPDEPLSTELLGLLPAALESPTRVAVALFVTTRVLRNIAAGLHDYVHAFKPQWDDWADAAAHSVVHWLGPFDQTLLRLYTVVAVVAGARVLIKWKTIALEFILHQRAGLAHANLAKQGSHVGKKRKGAAVSSSSFTSSGGPTAAGSSSGGSSSSSSC